MQNVQKKDIVIVYRQYRQPYMHAHEYDMMTFETIDARNLGCRKVTFGKLFL